VEQLGRYKIEEVLGRGAMGIVYRAHDPTIDRVVAIKTITIRGVTSDEEEEYRQRFFREARAAGKLSHPGVVTIYDLGQQDGSQTPYIVMEYIQGTTLDALISGSERTVSKTLDLMKQIAEALDYAHSQGIVHRDIKPANILVTPDGHAKITDFGIAKLAVNQLTMPGEALGTPAYMSPEQIAGGQVDGRSDLFSLGIMLYSMLAGEKPFPGDSATSVMFNITYKQPLPVTQLNPSLDSNFDQVIERALAKNPADRYQTGKEFAEILEGLKQGRTSPTQVQSLVEEDPGRTVLIQKPVQSVVQSVPTPSIPRDLRWTKKSNLAAQGFHKLRAALVQVAQPGFSLRITRKTQLCLASISVVLALFVFGSIGPAKAAKLEIRCVHSFVSADLFIWIDDKLSYEKELAGTVRKRLGLIKTVQGSLADAIVTAPGKHLVRVNVISKTAGYDQTREIQAELTSEVGKRLDIKFTGRAESLDVELR